MKTHVTLPFPAPLLAETTMEMRSRVASLSFAVGVYFPRILTPLWSELVPAVDTVLFWFRNGGGLSGSNPCAAGGYRCQPPRNGTIFPPLLPCTPAPRYAECPWGLLCDTEPTYCDGRYTSECLSGVCAEPTALNAPGEATRVAATLPPSKSLQVGFYASGHSSLGQASPRYVQDVIPAIAEHPRVDGIVGYTFHAKPPYGSYRSCESLPAYGSSTCNVTNLACIAAHVGCVIGDAYGDLAKQEPERTVLKADDAAELSVTSGDGSTLVVVDAAGSASVRAGVGGSSGRAARLLGSAHTALAGCARTNTTVRQLAEGGVQARAVMSCPQLLGPAHCVHLLEAWEPGSGSAVRWSSALGTGPCPGSRSRCPNIGTGSATDPACRLAPPFTTAIETALLPAPDLSRYFTTWGRGSVWNGETPPDPQPPLHGAWSSPLVSAPLEPAAAYRLGASPQINPETEWWTRLGMVANDSMSIPLVTLLPASGGGSALTLCLDPTETLLELMLSVSGEGAKFGRHFLRIGPGLQRRFSARLFAHRPSLRAGLFHVTQQWPSLFSASAGPSIANLSGLGAYGWDLSNEALNATWARETGLTTHWDLGGMWMPYDGL